MSNQSFLGVKSVEIFRTLTSSNSYITNNDEVTTSPNITLFVTTPITDPDEITTISNGIFDQVEPGTYEVIQVEITNISTSTTINPGILVLLGVDTLHPVPSPPTPGYPKLLINPISVGSLAPSQTIIENTPSGIDVAAPFTFINCNIVGGTLNAPIKILIKGIIKLF